MHILFLILGAYLLFHLGHSHAKWRANRHRGFLARTWISVPGPWGTRVSKRL